MAAVLSGDGGVRTAGPAGDRKVSHDYCLAVVAIVQLVVGIYLGWLLWGRK